MKVYSAPSADLETTIKVMVEHYHPDLQQCRLGSLFRFDDESDDQVLTHNGYPAAAVVRITPLRERALGVADAVIVVDRACWQVLKYEERCALIDHELTHLRPILDEETQRPRYDALGRPRLGMRRHDHQLGWFDEVAQRHGKHSTEVRQANALVASTAQLYFEFGPEKRFIPSGDDPSVPAHRVNYIALREQLAKSDVHISLGALQSRSPEDILAATLWLEATDKLGIAETRRSAPAWFPPFDHEGDRT